MDKIIELLNNISIYYTNMARSFSEFLQVVAESLSTATSLVSVQNAFPTFLYSMIQLVIGVLVVKAILSLGSHHE